MRKTLQDSGMKGRPRCIRPAVPEGRLEVRLQLVEEARHCSERPLTQLLTEVVWGSSAARHAAGREGFGTEMDGLSKTAKVISVTNRHTNNRTALTRGPARGARLGWRRRLGKTSGAELMCCQCRASIYAPASEEAVKVLKRAESYPRRVRVWAFVALRPAVLGWHVLVLG